MTFENFDLHPLLAANVASLGYSVPTPIQAAAIPSILDGRDLIGLAQTGTGKTAAFALPMLQRLLTQPGRGARRVRALVVAPTRELADQIGDSMAALAKGARLRGTCIYGGVGFGGQIQRLRAHVDIVVACPGRLLDHVRQGTIDLSGVEMLVLDEADRMFDMGFAPDIRRIVAQLPAQRQTLLFSATMPSDIRALAMEILSDPISIRVDAEKPVDTVAQGIYPVASHLKTDLLMAILDKTETQSVLVFTAAKHRATRLAEKLGKAGHRATSLQGNLSQNQRQAALQGFRNGHFRIMVATDVAARGIDVDRISHVINFDVPDTVESYTHRIGRTGRAERTGDAATFVTDDDQGFVRAVEKAIGAKLERRYHPDFDYKTSPASTTTADLGDHRPRQVRSGFRGAGSGGSRRPAFRGGARSGR